MNTADSTPAQRTVAVIGSGSWGTAIARLLGVKGVHVRLWSHGADTPAAINATHRNPRYLRDVELPTKMPPSTVPTMVPMMGWVARAAPS